MEKSQTMKCISYLKFIQSKIIHLFIGFIVLLIVLAPLKLFRLTA